MAAIFFRAVQGGVVGKGLMNFYLPVLLASCFKCLRPSFTISHALSVKYFF